MHEGDGSVPHPGVTVFLLEYLRDRATAVARPGCLFVDVRRVHPAECVGVSVARVRPTAAVSVVPARLHLAIFLAKVGVGAVARPCVRDVRSARRSVGSDDVLHQGI